MAQKLEENRDNAKLSYQLATIKCDVELEESPQTLLKQTPDRDALMSLYGKLAFKSWLTELLDGGTGVVTADEQTKTSSVTVSTAASHAAAIPESPAAHIDRSQYQTILNEQDFQLWLEKLKQAELFAFDTETDNLDYMVANLVGMSFAVAEGEAAYLPVAHDYLDAPQQLERDWVIAQLKPLLEDESKAKVAKPQIRCERDGALRR